MEKLLAKSTKKISSVSIEFERYLISQINLNNQLIAILGARGVGKTTMLLQLAKKSTKQVLYVALDDSFFSGNTLYSLAEDFQKTGGKILYLDEVHKYPNWSREIKLIYDDFANLQVVFTSSSILDIYRGESDLSRRAISYHLNALSFREYLLYYEKIELPKLDLKQIIENHAQLSLDITQQFKPFQYFKQYIETGAYPYYNNNTAEYYQQILNTLNLILDVENMRNEIADKTFDTVLCDPPYNGRMQWNHNLLAEMSRIAKQRIIFQHWFIPATPQGLYKKAQEHFALAGLYVWQPKTYFGRVQVVSVFDSILSA